MAVKTLTSKNLEETINENGIVVIDFWASWCGPCQAFKPIFEAASEKHQDAVFASCNTEEETELASMFQIQSIPTLVVFRDGIGIFSQPGMLPAEAIDELLEKVRELDMDQVRAEIEQQQEVATANAISFTARGPQETAAIVQLLMPKTGTKVLASPDVSVQKEWHDTVRILTLRFPNTAEDIRFRIEW